MYRYRDFPRRKISIKKNKFQRSNETLFPKSIFINFDIKTISLLNNELYVKIRINTASKIYTILIICVYRSKEIQIEIFHE